MIDMKLRDVKLDDAPFPHSKSLTIFEYFPEDSVAVTPAVENWKNDGKNVNTRGHARKYATVDGKGLSGHTLEPCCGHLLYANAPSPEGAEAALLKVVQEIKDKAFSEGVIANLEIVK